MRLVFFASGDFAIPTLESLLNSQHEVLAVVTQPDRPAGRGGKCRETPVKALAKKYGVDVIQPETPNTEETASWLKKINPDICVIVAYGHLIKKIILNIPSFGFINLHASLLPAYRGAAPVPWTILKGERRTGVTIFKLNEKFDDGDIIVQYALPIENTDTAGSLLTKLAPLGATGILNALKSLEEGSANLLPQERRIATNAPKLKKDYGSITWTDSVKQIDLAVRAFQPWPLAFTTINTHRGLVRLNVLKVDEVSNIWGLKQPGTILEANPKDGLIIMTGNGALRMSLIQAEGRKVMSDSDFLRGTKIVDNI